MTTVFLNRFDGGMTSDPRNPLSSSCRICSNYDVLTNPNKMTPYRSSVSSDSTAYASDKQNFAVALRTGTTYSLYALGHQSGNGKVEVMYKDLTTGAGHDLDDADWQSPSNNFSSAGTTNYDCFVYYPTMSKIYGFKGGNAIYAFYPGGSAFEEDAVSSETSGGTTSPSYTTVAQGLVNSIDDILYLPYDNKIATNNNGSWNLTAFTIPSRYYITSIAQHLNYISIAAAPKNGVGSSRIYLWARDTSITTADADIDCGDGIIKVLESINGRLIAISLSGANTTRFSDRVIFREYDGYGMNQVGLLLGGTTTQLPIAKQKINNRLYFMCRIVIDGTTLEGVWSVGPTSQGWTITHERTPNNDTVTTSGTMNNFIYVGDYLFQSYIDNGTYGLSKTDSTANYNITATRRTCINPGMPAADKQQLKTLVSVGATYESLPSAGQVVVKFRGDGGSWTTIYTETTDGVVFTEPTGANTGGKYKDLEFRVESNGGAEVPGISYKYAVLQSNV